MRIFGNPRRLAGRLTREAATTALAVVMGLGGWLFGPADAATAATPGGSAAAVASAAAWRADRIAGHPLPNPLTASPAAVARFFAGLTSGEGSVLAHRYPQIIGNLDGAPLALRYAADATLTARPHVIGYDPHGDGRIAEVVGDLATADTIAVIVPGVDNRLDNFETGYAGRQRRAPAWQARQLYQQVRADDRTAHVAVIAWLGYDAPEGIGRAAMREERARAGAAALARFVGGLNVYRPAARITLIGHSYGSVVVGLAAHSLGRQVHDIVAVGSPGMSVDKASQLHTKARVWAGSAPTDWTRRLPDIRLFGVGHGTLPIDPGFGALPLPAGNVLAHDGYFVPGTESLRAMAEIVLGRSAAEIG